LPGPEGLGGGQINKIIDSSLTIYRHVEEWICQATRPGFKKTKNYVIIMMKTIWMSALATCVACFGLLAADAKKSQDIVDIAVEAGSFKTLVAAVQAAGLVDTLKSKGPFTVFAPTDEAFAKLPEGTVEMLLKPENKDKLIAVLTYHVVGAEVMSSAIKPGAVKTVQGQEVKLTLKDGGVLVNDAKVVKADISASNGVIHVIDTVILPKF